MAKSKYQIKAKTEIKQKQSGKKHTYYDEELSKKKNNSPFVFFIGFIVIIGLGIVGVGKLLDSQNNDELVNSITYTYTGDSTEVSSSPSGYKTPLSLSTIDGSVIELADNAGKVVVLYFHYISCYYCEENGQNLKTVMGEYSSDEVLIIAIDVQISESVADIQQWASENEYTWSNVRDTDYSLASKYSVSGTPSMVFLGKDGSYSQKLVGLNSADNMRSAIDKLL
ncbi:TlpA family protein disulfide reductase [Candidatus Lokiarchaeum ossiferum]|uniref:TlpA family protein disulfide reductase n=1 Tax=Candidatus Lokiarchaeum ossiferum TaxID=2951803 RepID=UPI00352E1104